VKHAFAAAAAALLAGVTVAASKPEFTQTWKSPDAAGVSFVGKKVAALVMTSDQNLRISAEEALARQLEARGAQAIATYRIAPAPELASADRARPWFERAGIEGVVALRPVSYDKDVVYTPSTWVTGYYSTLWGYYGYGWTTVYSLSGDSQTETTLVIETLVYSLPKDRLLWAGVSTTTNPKEAQTFVKDLVAEAVKEMKKQKLVK
jgi:hypothetical protein